YEIYVHRGFYFDSLPIQKQRLIFPLRDGIYRGLDQEWMTFYDLNFLHSAVASDHASQSYLPRDVRLVSQGRIDWLHLLDEVRVNWPDDFVASALLLLRWHSQACEERTKESEDESVSHYRVRHRRVARVPRKETP